MKLDAQTRNIINLINKKLREKTKYLEKYKRVLNNAKKQNSQSAILKLGNGLASMTISIEIGTLKNLREEIKKELKNKRP